MKLKDGTFKPRVTTIKKQVLNFIARNSEKGGTDRKRLIWRILIESQYLEDSVAHFEYFKKNYSKKYRSWYSTNICKWHSEGLVKRNKGVYFITERGKEYIKNPNKVNKDIREERRQRQEEGYINFYIERLQESYDFFFGAGMIENLSGDNRTYIEQMAGASDRILQKLIKYRKQ